MKSRSNRRGFSPAVDGLEYRQLLSQILIRASQCSALTLNSDAIANVKQSYNTATADIAVGAAYSIQVWQEAPAKFASAVYSMPHSLNGDATSYGTGIGGYSYRTSLTQVNTADVDNGIPGVREYLDATTGTLNINVNIKYDTDTGVPDDKYQITLNVQAPMGTLNAYFPPNTGPASYGIGPVDASNARTAWGYVYGNEFGVSGPSNSVTGAGQFPFYFNAIGYNTTSVPGYFFLSQVVNPVSGGSAGALFTGPFGSGYSPWRDTWGRTDAGLDVFANKTVPGFPVADNGHTYFAPANASVPTLVGGEVDNPGQANPMSSTVIPYQYDYHASFQTVLCFQAGSHAIPVVLSYVNWAVDAGYLNTTARDNATTANAFGDPSLWVGSATVTPGTPVNNSPMLFPRYKYNAPDYMANTSFDYPAQDAVLGVPPAVRGHHLDHRGAVRVGQVHHPRLRLAERHSKVADSHQLETLGKLTRA